MLGKTTEKRGAFAGSETYQGDQALIQAEGLSALGGLLERGMKIAQLARGAATARSEIVARALASIVEGVTAVIVRVNVLPDPE